MHESKNLKIERVGEHLRSFFPFYSMDKGHHHNAYLDTAASALKFQTTIDRMVNYLSYEHANIHRGAYQLSASATMAYEESRAAVSSFFGLSDDYVVVFTSGATDGVNLVAFGCQDSVVSKGDAVLTTLLEHHSNFVPWQQLALRVEGSFITADIRPDTTIDIDDFNKKLDLHHPKVVAVTAHSNAFGTIVDLNTIVRNAKAVGALVLVDATQSVVHGNKGLRQECGADFYVFSCHKLYGPTGLGVLVAKKESLERLNLYRSGGGMIRSVAVDYTTFADLPERFEAGTPPIAEAIAFKSTLEQLSEIHSQFEIEKAEDHVFKYAMAELKKLKGLKIVGPAAFSDDYDNQSSIISFEVAGIHPHDLSSIADSYKVQIRAGHHCCMPALTALGVQSTARLSLGLYSSTEDIDKLITAIDAAKKMFN